MVSRVSCRSGGDLLFHALRRSTIGAEGFHGRVRDGIGCWAPRHGHQAGTTHGSATLPRLRRGFRRGGRGERDEATCGRCVGWRSLTSVLTAMPSWRGDHSGCWFQHRWMIVPPDTEGDGACRVISTARLHALLHFDLRPIDVVVFHGSQGDLVSRGASRLDAFSGYPVRT